MLAGLGLYQFLSGLWANTVAAPPELQDCNGDALALNQTVKLVGTVVALNREAEHFDSVTIQLVHPNGNGPLARTRLSVSAEQLVIGS